MRRPLRLTTLTAAAAAAATVVATIQPVVHADPGKPAPSRQARAVQTAGHGQVPASAKVQGLQHLTGRQPVFVQLAGAGAAAVSSHTMRTAPGHASARASEARSAALARRADVASHARAALDDARRADSKAQSLFVVSNAVPGFGVVADRAAIEALAQRSDVVKVSAIVPKTASNAYPAQLTRVLNTWQDTGTLGAGVTVGIIDTGLDYTHKDFGGDGDYAAAQANAGNKLFDWRAAQPALLRAKVAGGWDFVGDDYNADPQPAPGESAYQPVPHPDPNPLDCNEHGTHVAGTVAGYGEDAKGRTFTGNYSKLKASDLDGMKIGPGMAPAATLYSLKVFGCSGSTDVVIPALDLALDPNGDGNFADHLDVVNLSLGSDYAPVDDPENAVIDQLAKHGVLPVIAMGNGGDLTDVGGAPGNAVRSLAVASSVDAAQLRDGMRVNAPATLPKVVAGQMSVAYPWSTAAPVTGDAVTMPGASLADPVADNADGCQAFTADQQAAVKGKVVVLVWDDNDSTRRCGSAGRSANARAAGAIGAIFTSTLDVFGAGITGDESIPVFQVPKASTQGIWAAAAAGTLNVTFDGSLQATIKDVNPSINDTISSFSSRGTHGSIGVVKPDVAAPGDTIASAGMGTGDGVLVISGTSMATPHTAGISALVKAAHPDWDTEQLKAAIMNNADHDLYTGEDHSGQIYGPARDGAGRVDALSAVNTHVLAYDTDVEGAVSASFGVVEAPIAGGPVTETRTVRVQNTGGSAVTYDVSYAAAVKQPGVSYSFQPSTVAVPAHTAGTVQVTMTVDPAALRHTIDPTMATNQLGVPRQFVSDASGRMLLTQQGGAGQVLRVPVYAAAKPVADMSASVGSSDGHPVVDLTGDGFAEGNESSDYTSLVSVMDFGAESPKLPSCAPDGTVADCTLNQTAEGGDIRYVGAGASPGTDPKTGDPSLANGWLWFGLSTYGDSATLGNSVIPYVDFDTTGDGKPDYEVYLQNATGSDVPLAWLVDLKTGETLDAEPVNTLFGDVDTNVFDTDAVLIPVWPKMIGLTDETTSFPITYSVGTFSSYGSPVTGDIDHSPSVTFDAANPAVPVDGPLWVDEPGTIPLGAPTSNAKALVLHLHNSSGDRAEVLTLPTVKAAAPVGLTLDDTSVARGQQVTATVTVPQEGATSASGDVSLVSGGKTVTSGQLVDGAVDLTFSESGAGQYPMVAEYAGDSNYQAGSSDPVTLDVARSRARVSLALSPNPVRHGRTVTATVRVSTVAGVPATGRVVLRKGNGHAVAHGTVSNGVATVKFVWRSRKDPRIHAAYAGDTNYRPGTSRAVRLVSR